MSEEWKGIDDGDVDDGRYVYRRLKAAFEKACSNLKFEPIDFGTDSVGWYVPPQVQAPAFIVQRDPEPFTWEKTLNVVCRCGHGVHHLRHAETENLKAVYLCEGCGRAHYVMRKDCRAPRH